MINRRVHDTGKRGYMRALFLAVPSVILLLLAFVTGSYAMSAYARSFDMKCGECHKPRIPELNDFGIAFYKNGFALPDSGKPKPDNAPQGGEKETAAPADSPDTPPRRAPDTPGSPDDTGEPPPGPPPEVPLVIYQGQAGDGSVYFTDNPLNKRLQPPAKKPSGRAAARPAKVRPPVNKTEFIAPKKPAAPTYRSYRECMERQLEHAQEGSTQQMMDLLMAAEGVCAPYSKGQP